MHPTDLYYNASEPQYPQSADWTCSACAYAWLNRALAIARATDEWSAVDTIGTTDHINATYGLMDGSGGRLVNLLQEDGVRSLNAWLGWAQVYQLAQRMPLLMGGQLWYHWTGVRSASNGLIWLANSAPGWMGVYQQMDQARFEQLGPFAVVLAPLHISFPPPPTS